MDHEITIRVSLFFALFLVLALGERLKPRRVLAASKKRRWFVNLTIMVVDSLLVRLVFPLLPVGMALLGRERGWGLFNHTDLSFPLELTGAVLLLDGVLYLQHVLFHAIPTLWRFHLMHHLDRDLDVTSGVRFHPVEMLFSTGIKVTAIGLIGPSPSAVLVFEIVLNGCSMFNHSNIFIPLAMDRLLRLFLVTPDMHRVHHSVILKERESNFGFAFPWWDRLCGTYRAQPEKGHQGMTIGNSRFLDEGRGLWWLLFSLPLSRRVHR